MKNLTIFFALFFLFNSCSNDDNSSDENQQQEEQLLDGGSAKTSQLVIINSDILTQDEYQGTLGNQSVTILKTNENEIVFKVPDEMDLGEQILTIPNLSDLKIKYQILENNIIGTATENITPYFNTIENYLATIQGTETQVYLSNVLNSFEEGFNNLNENEKMAMAKFYQANKNYFDGIINNDFSSRSSLNMQSGCYESSIPIPPKYQIAVFIAAGSAVLALFAPVDLASKALLALTAIVALKKANDINDTFLSFNCIKVNNMSLNDLFADLQTRSINNSLELTSGVSASLPLKSETRAVILSDNEDDNNVISTFFGNHFKFNDTVESLNNAINFINENFFLSNIDLIPISVINGSNPTIITLADQEYFNRINFSIESNNVNIDNLTFANGNLNITTSIIDPSVVNDFIDTTINFTYEDEFNLLVGRYIVNIYKGNEVDILTYNQFIYDCGGGPFEPLNISFFSDLTMNIEDVGSVSGCEDNGTYSFDGTNLSFNYQSICDETSPFGMLSDFHEFTGALNSNNDIVGNLTITVQVGTADPVTNQCTAQITN